MKIYLIAMLAAALFTAHMQANAGEDVTVTWTPPSDISSLPYDGYFIYYTDSTGSGHKIAIDDPAATEHVVPDVEFGPSSWLMTSRCNQCTIKESEHSNTVDFVVEFKGTPSPPNIIEIVSYKSPSADLVKFRAKVAGIKYRGECQQKRKHDKVLKCSGKRIN